MSATSRIVRLMTDLILTLTLGCLISYLPLFADPISVNLPVPLRFEQYTTPQSVVNPVPSTTFKSPPPDVSKLGILLVPNGLDSFDSSPLINRYSGTNPSSAAIWSMIIAAGQQYQIPPHILAGIAFQESGWREFGSDGQTLVSSDGGIGIMQLTGSTAAQFDVNRLAYDIAYNIQCGAQVLSGKWAATPIIGDNDRAKLENWYYAIWAYNGFVRGSTYPQTILHWIANCPNGQWQNVNVTPPNAAQIASMTTIPNTPSPFHVDANFDGIIDGTGGGGGNNVSTVVSESAAAPSNGAPGFWQYGSPPLHDATDCGDGGHMFWTYTNGPSIDNMGDWRPNLPANGNYKVSIYIPSNHGTTKLAHYEVYAADGQHVVVVNQLSYSNVWVSLGTFPFVAGSSNYLRLTDGYSESYNGSTEVAFDTAKWDLQAPPTPPSVSFSGSPVNRWYGPNDLNTSVVTWTLNDTGGGIGGLSQNWDNDPGGSSPQFPGSHGGYMTLGYLSASQRQGKHTAYVRAWSGDDSQSQVYSWGWYGYDTLPPTATVNSGQVSGLTYNSAQHITFHIDDSDSGVAGWGAAWDSDAAQQSTSSDGALDLPAGTHMLNVHVWDNVGNQNDYTFGPYTYQPIVIGAWRAVDIATGPDNITHVLWTNPNGQMTPWVLNSNNQQTSQSPAFGPYPGWTAKAISVGPDNITHILWTNANGQMTPWTLNANNQMTSQSPAFGPYPGWTAVDIATGPDNITHVLWTNANGQMTPWTLNSNNQMTSQSPAFGPYPGWTAKAISVGPDNITHVLWTNTSGQMTPWTLNANNQQTSQSSAFGPFADWTAVDIATGPDNITHVLWTNSNGQMTPWTLNANNQQTSQSPAFGPFADWGAKAISVGPDDITHILWTNPNGQMTPWTLNSNNQMTSQSPAFGPY